MQIILLSCLKATEFVEKRINYKLSLKERIQLKLHTSMCKACSDYEKQSTLIEKIISETKYNTHNKTDDKEDLTSLKKTIIKNIS